MSLDRSKNRTPEEREVVRLRGLQRTMSRLEGAITAANEMMVVYADQINGMQEKAHGSLFVALQVCKEDGCSGCYHVRWKRYFDPQKDQRKRQRMYGKKVGENVAKSAFYSADIKNPLQMLPRGDEFRGLRETVKAFEEVRKVRGQLVSNVKNALIAASRIDC